MSGQVSENSSQSTNGTNKVNNGAGERSFTEIQQQSTFNNHAEKVKRIQYISHLNQQYKNELTEYNRKLKVRATQLKHSVDDIRKTRNTLIAKNISYIDFAKIFELSNHSDPDWVFAQKIANNYATEKAKSDKNFSLQNADKSQLVKEIRANPKFYYDYIEYKHHNRKHDPGSKQWTAADIKALVAGVDLSTWSYDDLKDLSINGLVKIPREKTSYGEIEASYRNQRLEETLKNFKLQVEKLEEVKDGAAKLLQSEDSFKHLSEDNQAKAKESLSELISHITEISAIKNKLFNESDFEKKIKRNKELYSFLKDFTAPDPNAKQLSKTDKIMNSYLDFALSMNQIGADSEEMSISEEQKSTIDKIQQFIQTVTELNESYESRFEGNLYVPESAQAGENGEKFM